MIAAYKTVERNLITLPAPEKDAWMNVVAPTPAELKQLSRDFDIPESFLTDPLDVDERARVEREEDNILIIIRVPYYDYENIDVPYSTLPLGIIFAENLTITVCNRETEILDDFINQKVRAFSTENKTLFLCQILLKIALLYLRYLKQINTLTGRIEEELRDSMKNEELIRLLNCEKSLVFFTTSLKSNEFMIDRLIKTQPFIIDEETQDRLDDIVVEYRQAIEMSNIYSNILSGMMDAFASIISNNLNVVMKFLTSVTIVLMLPTLVASVYGMNVQIPLQHSPHAFLITMAMSVCLGVLAVVFFWKRRWF